MLLADEILLASHFPHKQAPAVRIFLYFEIEWKKLCETKSILGKLSKVWPSGLVLGWEVALRLMCPASRRHSFSSSSASFLFLSSPSFLSSSLINSLGGFLKGPEAICCTHSWQRPSLVIHFFYLTLIMSMKIVVRQADTLKISTLSTNEQVEDEGLRNFLQPVVPVCRVITWLITHNDFWKAGDIASWKMWARPTWRYKSSTCATHSNTFWEMKKTFLLKVHVFFLAKRNSWRNIIARVVTGDKLWLEKNCKVYLDSDLHHLLAGGAPDLGCCLASLPKTIFA